MSCRPLGDRNVFKNRLLTISVSSMVLCVRPGVPAVAGAPFRRLYWVNRMFMVARSTSDRLCLTYGSKYVYKTLFLFIFFYRKEREKLLFRFFFLTSSLKFLKAATLSSTLSWLRGRSFKRSITWHKQEGAISTTAGLHVKHTVISKTKKKEWVIKGQNQRVVWFVLEIISGGEVKVHRGDLNGTDIHTINHLWF